MAEAESNFNLLPTSWMPVQGWMGWTYLIQRARVDFLLVLLMS